jgi:hypothetical protein
LPRLWFPGGRRAGIGYATSGLLHVIAFGTAAMVTFSLPDRLELPQIDSLWTRPEPPRPLVVEVVPPAAKRRYLEWAATMDANGAPADPRLALELALKMKPDIIYVLTDGEFDLPIDRALGGIQQSRTTIHTFAFGERFGEAVLKEVAKNNHGNYTFVP